MKTRHWAGVVVLGLIGAAGCTGSVATGAGGGGTGAGVTTSSSSSSSSGKPITCPPPEPKNHRATETVCGLPTPPMSCTTDADCVSPVASPGKCVASAGGQVCDFNACTTDADCPHPNEACSCQNETFGYAHTSPGSVCIPGNCHTDGDCGAGLFCSPTVDSGCGNFYGITGFYCHTCQDTCVNDSDCVTPGPMGYCAFDPSVGHWACGFGVCAG